MDLLSYRNTPDGLCFPSFPGLKVARFASDSPGLLGSLVLMSWAVHQEAVSPVGH
jgi:hypothetical protein